MPVTTTAKRALRGSQRKASVNKKIMSDLEIAIRLAEKSEKKGDAIKAVSLADRAAKKNIIHKNKASRIKSNLSRFMAAPKKAKSKKLVKKTKNSSQKASK